MNKEEFIRETEETRRGPHDVPKLEKVPAPKPETCTGCYALPELKRELARSGETDGTLCH